MRVKEIMSCSVRSVQPDTRVIEVASLMCLYRFHGLPVVEDENMRLVGLIAEKDVLHSLFPTLEILMREGMGNVDLDREMGKYKDVLSLPVSDLMTPNPISVRPDIHILQAATTMVRHRFRRIPVAQDGILVGMLSLGDVHKAIFHANVTSQFQNL